MTEFNFINIIAQFERTSNRFNRDDIIAGIKAYFERNPESLASINKAYLNKNKQIIDNQLKACIQSIKAGDDVKYRTYLAICFILNNCYDEFLNSINFYYEIPVSKIHRQEMLLKDVHEGAIDIKDVPEMYGVDKRSIRLDVDQLREGQGLVREYLGYLPDTGEKIGLNIEIKKDHVMSLSKAHPLKLLLTTKEVHQLIEVLENYVKANTESNETTKRILGEIIRNASEPLWDIMAKTGLKSGLTKLEDRIDTLKRLFVLIDRNSDFNWRRFNVTIHFFEDDKLQTMSGKVIDIQNDHIVFQTRDQKEKQILIADILEICARE